MYRVTQDFIEEWRDQSASTLKLLRVITDQAGARRIYPEGRSLKELAWHLVDSLSMLTQAGLPVESPPEGTPVPESMAEVVAAYERSSESVLHEAQTNWPDAMLLEEVNLFGRTWKKGRMLSLTIVHQAHHRGQMTVLARQAGLQVPGVAGPAREEWAAMGMNAPA